MKETMVFRKEWIPLLKAMGDKSIEVLEALAEYDNTGEKTELELNALEQAVYNNMIADVRKSRKAYDEKCEQNRENGKKGGAPKGNQNARKQPKTTERLIEQPKQAEYEYEYDCDNDNDVVAVQPEYDYYEAVTESWNRQECTQNIMNIKPMTRREDRVRMCMMEFPDNAESEFLKVIDGLDEQAWFKTRGNPVTFDWFVTPDNFRKVLEGNYKESYKPKNKALNFDQRQYSSADYEAIERAMGG